MAQYKTYQRRNFSHKKAVWDGMDQGKGTLHRGDSVEFMLNVDVGDGTFTTREGQEVQDTGSERIQAGKRTVNGTSIVVGSGLYFSESVPAI